jgi:general stress protein 26
MAKHTPREELDKLIHSFNNAMLITRTWRGMMRARPMGLARADGNELWFITSADTGKIDELELDPHVAVVMQDSRRFVSISGKAELVHDRAKAAEVWTETSRPWFPEGPKDPKLLLIKVRGEEAEYWDLTGLEGAKYVFDAVRHAIKRDRMDEDSEDVHARVRL